ncbi:hypothetical protein MKEN_01016900 [Mycena kentingensis (nom. inval.)]|nr:hypothetical protein MKEN_01016900 [Mycena kentingensis (nom. inval.)]
MTDPPPHPRVLRPPTRVTVPERAISVALETRDILYSTLRCRRRLPANLRDTARESVDPADPEDIGAVLGQVFCSIAAFAAILAARPLSRLEMSCSSGLASGRPAPTPEEELDPVEYFYAQATCILSQLWEVRKRVPELDAVMSAGRLRACWPRMGQHERAAPPAARPSRLPQGAHRGRLHAHPPPRDSLPGPSPAAPNPPLNEFPFHIRMRQALNTEHDLISVLLLCNQYMGGQGRWPARAEAGREVRRRVPAGCTSRARRCTYASVVPPLHAAIVKAQAQRPRPEDKLRSPALVERWEYLVGLQVGAPVQH